MESKFCVYCMQTVDNSEFCSNCGKSQSAYVAAPHYLKHGTILNGKYLVGAVLGEGGFGITYIGKDISLDMKVAIKEFFPSGIVNRNNTSSNEITSHAGKSEESFDKGKDSFLSEARTLAKFSSDPSIVSVYDFFSENNTAYIAMEYLEGTDLKDYIAKNGKMSFEKAVSLVAPVMKGLSKVHSQGLIHRDISPANIMILNDGQVKLLDFGAARDVSGADEKSLSILLKPGFAPEEQYRTKGKQGPWTDVYALSATMYKMLTGVTPEDAMNRIFSDELKSIRELNPNVTAEQEAVILKGMAIHQENRYQNTDELYAACQDALSGKKRNLNSAEKTVKTAAKKVQSQKDKSIKQSRPARKKKKNLGKIIGGIAAVCVLLLVIVIVYTSLSTITIGDEKIKRNETVVSLVGDVITDNDLAKLKDLKKLESLEIFECFLENDDLKVLSELTQLKKLSISGNTDITDVSELNNLENLEYLNISITGVEDISCLDKLTKLQTLVLGYTKVSDLSCLENYSVLNALNIESLSELDHSTIKLPASLETLYCAGNNLENLEFLSTVDSLLNIYASRNNISDLSPLSGYDRLYMCDLSVNNISDISALPVENLDDLDLSTNSISDISHIHNMESISYLDLAYNQITDISALEGCHKLHNLKLNNNNISDISAIRDCFRIHTLDISYNQVSDISAVATIDDLERFTARSNQITDISSLASCETLKSKASSLDLRDNQISDISGFNGYTSLKHIYISNNNITDISPLAGCSSLTHIWANNNQISDVSPLGKLINLNGLQIVDNPISDLSGLNMVGSEGVLNSAVLRISYNENIDWEMLNAKENFKVWVYDVPEREQDMFYESNSDALNCGSSKEELDEVIENEDLVEASSEEAEDSNG